MAAAGSSAVIAAGSAAVTVSSSRAITLAALSWGVSRPSVEQTTSGFSGGSNFPTTMVTRVPFCPCSPPAVKRVTASGKLMPRKRAGGNIAASAVLGDLVAAGACGLRTAFVPRPTEHGPGQTSDLRPDHDVELVASDFIDLARQLGVGRASCP